MAKPIPPAIPSPETSAASTETQTSTSTSESEAAVRLLGDWRSRLLAIGAVVGLFLLIWVELAVGLIGTPFAGS